MKPARSTTKTISVNHKISQTVLHAAQITAVAFLTLVLVVGLQAATASLAHATGTDTPTHSDVETLEGDWEDPCEVWVDCDLRGYPLPADPYTSTAICDWPPEPMCLAELSDCMGDGWLSAWVDLTREIDINRQYSQPLLAGRAAVWENVDFSAYNRDEWLDPFRHCIQWCSPIMTLG